MRFRNYRNSHTNENKIYSVENIQNMTVKDAFSRKQELLAQNRSIGVPTEDELKNSPNAVWVDEYVRDDGTKVRGHWRSKPEGGVEDDSEDNQSSNNDGMMTGAAGKVDRTVEAYLPQNNDDFFEKERARKGSVLMRHNGEKNIDRPDAKLFMDIALVGPDRVPSCKDYRFINSDIVKVKLERYNVIPERKDGEKEAIKDCGVVFSQNSPTAQRLNNSKELKDEILSAKNYDSKTGCFKSDKLAIELSKDKNLYYSIGHMTILNPQITEDGYITGLAYDRYDFSWLESDVEGNDVNNCAFVLQQMGHIKNYYIFVPIKIKL